MTARNFNRRRSGSVQQKHWMALRGYWTPRKIANLALCEWEKRTRSPRVRSMPYTAHIDVTNACNLRCPGCPTGAGLVGRKKTMLDMGRLRRFLDETGPYLLMAHLFNWGEMLLHPRAPEVVEMIHRRRIFTSMNSNLNVRDFSVLEAVCDAGVDHLLISADGATPESYSKYRVGGDFNLVVENIRRLVDYRRRKGRTKPVLEWQILAFNYLESEIEAAYVLAAELGIDWFRVKGPTAPESLQPAAESLRGVFYGGRTVCAHLWHNVVLQADGGLAPCCNIYYKKDDFGHLDEMSVREIRSGSRFEFGRRLFSEEDAPHPRDEPDHPCLRCPMVHAQPHLRDTLLSREEWRASSDFMGILQGSSEEDRVWKGRGTN